jgi:lipoprotein-anchoring transpeptidase ErfK/SrfK
VKSRKCLAVAVATAIAAVFCAPAAGARERPVVKPTQELVALLKSHGVFSKPGARRRASTMRWWRPITRGQTVLPVVGRTTTKDGVRWLRVMLPGRPNGSKGWIARQGTVTTATSWHIVVRTARRQALVYRNGKLVRTLAVIVGKPSTPTPHGEFFVEENVIMPSGAPGGPYALALSARSNVYQQFEGGPGQIGIHGIANLGGTLGTAQSNGCVRLSNRSITWLAARIAPGAPVTIRS